MRAGRRSKPVLCHDDSAVVPEPASLGLFVLDRFVLLTIWLAELQLGARTSGSLLPKHLPLLSRKHAVTKNAPPSVPRRISGELANVLDAIQARLLPVAVAVEIANADQRQARQNPGQRQNVGRRRVRHVHLSARRCGRSATACHGEVRSPTHHLSARSATHKAQRWWHTRRLKTLAFTPTPNRRRTYFSSSPLDLINKNKELRWGFIKNSTKFAEKRQEERTYYGNNNRIKLFFGPIFLY